jgi:predicted permease
VRATAVARAAARALAASPPLAATLAALALGASPAGPALFLGAAEHSSGIGGRSLEVAALLAAGRTAVAAARLLAPAALPGQLLVLGASLAPVRQNRPGRVGRPPPLPAGVGVGPGGGRGFLPALASAAVGPDGRALAAVLAVRCVALPLLAWAGLSSLRAAGLPAAADPVAALVLALQAAVPTAQTLVVMAGVDGEGALAARLAGLTVRLYVWGALPLCACAIGAARWAGVGA